VSVGEVIQALIANTMISVRADVSDIKAKMKELGAVEKQTHEQILKGAEARGKGLDQLKQKFTEFTAYVKAAQIAVDFFGDTAKEFEKEAERVGGAQLDKAREFRTALNDMNEAWRQGKVMIGEFVVALGPAIRNLAIVVQLLEQIAKRSSPLLSGNNAGLALGVWGVDWSGGSNWIAGDAREKQVAAYLKAEQDAATRAGLLGGSDQFDSSARTRAGLPGWGTGVPGFGAASVRTPTKGRGGGGYDLFEHGGREVQGFRVGGGWSDEMLQAELARRQALKDFEESIGGLQDRLAGGPTWDHSKFDDLGGLAQKAAGYGAQIQQERRSAMLESIFGPLDEFSAYEDALSGLTEAVGIFGSALQSGFEAWITGSKSFADAFKAAMGQTILAIASSLFAHSIEHGVAAIGALAWGIGGNPKGFAEAAAHGKAALAYAAGAAAVGGLGRALGAASWGSGAGAGASTGGGGAAYVGGNAGGTGTTQYILVGDGFGSDSPRFEKRRAQRSYKLAQRTVSDSNVVRWG
jgi:hypothetical protein